MFSFFPSLVEFDWFCHFTHYNRIKLSFQTVDPEIDSTTDLLPIESSMSSSSSSESSSSSSSESSSSSSSSICCDIETFSMQPTHEQQKSLFPTSIQSSMSSTVASSNACSVTNFPTTPDLITLFDEEINKSSDMCQYSELFPYNNVITQALMNCEVNSLCEQSTSNDLGNNITDLTFLSSVNQTSIDNLKALTNIQNPQTNFLSGITLPKNSYNDTVSAVYLA